MPRCASICTALTALIGCPFTSAEVEAVPDFFEPEEIQRPDAGYAEDQASGDATAIDEISLAVDEFERMYSDDRYDSAINEAKRVVQLCIDRFGLENTCTTTALTNLAITQHRNDELEAAEENFEAAISQIEAMEDNLSPRLIVPLRGLGKTLLDLGLPLEAVSANTRALHVSHVNHGPRNLDQADILREMSDAYVALSDLVEADRLQVLAMRLFQLRYPDNDERLVPILYQRADWLNHAGAHIMERSVYTEIIEIIEANQGSNALELIFPLTKVAETYRLHPEIDPFDGLTDGYAPYRRALQTMERAASIAEANPNADRLMYVDTVISLGDYSNIFQFRGKARRSYSKAWSLLGEQDEHNVYREQRFGAPTLIQGGEPAPLYELIAGKKPVPFEESADYRHGYVVVQYDVTARGRTKNIRVFESYPPGLMDREVTRIVNRFKYRPRMIEGQAVPTESLRFRHEFKYYLRHVPDKVLARMKKVATHVEPPYETEND